MSKQMTTIIKRDGRKVPYKRDNIALAIWKSLFAVQKVQRTRAKGQGLQVEQQAAELTIEEQELDKNSSEWKEAKRLSEIVEQLLIKSNGNHQWAVEEIQDVVEQILLAAGHEEVAKAYILHRNRHGTERFPLSLSPHPSALGDRLGMSDNAYAAMARRYLWKDNDGNLIETPIQAMMRVATAVASIEDGPPTRRTVLSKKWKDKYLDIMTNLEFVPAGCYFRGAGNKQNGSLANCFVLPVEDSIEQIFEAVKWSAQIHQMGGGTGFNFSHLRPRGDVVRSGGLASGPINFMKAFNAETQVVMQGGEHRGANMGILNVDHPDIFDFIVAKTVEGDISNFNVSIGAFDSFMHAVRKSDDWKFINPKNRTTVQSASAKTLWDQIIHTAWKTGDPGMIYLDSINRANPVLKALGPIESTNVCGEQPLHPFDVCNLGSINLAKFVKKTWWEEISLRTILPESEGWSFSDNINWRRLEHVVRTAVHFLDDGVDASTYPIPQIAEMARKLRRIGLGIMGWADMLVQLGIRYDSDTGIKMAESIMKFIQEISWDESEKISKEKAPFPLWNESYFNSVHNPFGKRRRVRNVAVTTIAPTGTISMIADCNSGIEPYFALEYTKHVVEKEGLKYMNKYYQEASEKVGPSNAERSNLHTIFRTAHAISPDWHVKMQAAFQRYTDNAVSKTINFSNSATVKDVENAYMLAWELGCKGITVYRDGAKEHQILKEEGKRTKDKGESKFNLLQPTAFNLQPSHIAQSQLRITPLSQRAYQLERREIVESVSGGNCPDCGSVLEMTEGCSICRNCGYSKCSI